MKKLGNIIILLLPVMVSCSKGPKPINYGSEECVFCKMTILDRHFACQLVNTKTKAYNFDDITCLLGFLQAGSLAEKDIAGLYVADYTGKNDLMPAEKMFYVESEAFHSPMSGNTAAFTHQDSALAYVEKLKGRAVQWKQLRTSK